MKQTQDFKELRSTAALLLVFGIITATTMRVVRESGVAQDSPTAMNSFTAGPPAQDFQKVDSIICATDGEIEKGTTP